MLKNDRTYYKSNILIAVIISEILVISAFILFPRISAPDNKIILSDPVILFGDVPPTTQSSAKQVPSSPEIPPVHIPEDINAFETLDDVAIVQGALDNSEKSAAGYRAENSIQQERSAPRLLYDVVPAGGEDDFHGRLQLSLKINENGKVIDHRILYNSLNCTDCLDDLIKAAYKSKWEPADVNGKSEIYWVVKSYSFN